MMRGQGNQSMLARNEGRASLPRPDNTEVVMGWFGWMLVVIVWVAIAFWPARVAARKGHSFFGYFVFSLIFFPAALIVAYMVQDRSLAAA
jgi:hypothetical protein